MLQSQLEQQSKAVDTIIGNMRVGALCIFVSFCGSPAFCLWVQSKAVDTNI